MISESGCVVVGEMFNSAPKSIAEPRKKNPFEGWRGAEAGVIKSSKRQRMSSDFSASAPIFTFIFVSVSKKATVAGPQKREAGNYWKSGFVGKWLVPGSAWQRFRHRFRIILGEGCCWTAIAFLPLTFERGLTTTDNWNNRTDFSVTKLAFQLAQPPSWKVIRCKLAEVFSLRHRIQDSH